jgi:hypothetical protein
MRNTEDNTKPAAQVSNSAKPNPTTIPPTAIRAQPKKNRAPQSMDADGK